MKSQPHNFIFSALLSLVILSASSCHNTDGSRHLVGIAAVANDNLLLLDGDIDTFDESKMKALSLNYSSVASFLETKGKPRYIAERKDRDDHKIVFYYPDEKKAYACRNVIGSKSEMEFSGPFPILDEELQRLSELEGGVNQKF